MVYHIRASIDYNHIPAVIDSLPAQGKKAAERYAKAARDIAKTIVPVRTGRLKQSIDTVQVGPMDFETYTDIRYARFVEWGTRFMHAQPFMTPAAQMAQGDLPLIGMIFGIAVDSAAITGRIQN